MLEYSPPQIRIFLMDKELEPAEQDVNIISSFFNFEIHEGNLSRNTEKLSRGLLLRQLNRVNPGS
jgi:hypothetical protein